MQKKVLEHWSLEALVLFVSAVHDLAELSLQDWVRLHVRDLEQRQVVGVNSATRFDHF